jgi:hypothetical protein
VVALVRKEPTGLEALHVCIELGEGILGFSQGVLVAVGLLGEVEERRDVFRRARQALPVGDRALELAFFLEDPLRLRGVLP